MAELTQEQLDLACAEVVRKHYDPLVPVLTMDVLRTAAPFLQLPWHEPMHEELVAIQRLFPVSKPTLSDLATIASEFVRLRNAALAPKQADFRRQVIATELGALGIDVVLGFKAADKILAALDEVK